MKFPFNMVPFQGDIRSFSGNFLKSLGQIDCWLTYWIFVPKWPKCLYTSLVSWPAGLESMLDALADLQMKTFKEACQVRMAWREWSAILSWRWDQGTYDNSMINY